MDGLGCLGRALVLVLVLAAVLVLAGFVLGWSTLTYYPEGTS